MRAFEVTDVPREPAPPPGATERPSRGGPALIAVGVLLVAGVGLLSAHRAAAQRRRPGGIPQEVFAARFSRACALALDVPAANGTGNATLLCEPDGTYAPLQCLGDLCGCVDPSSGQWLGTPRPADAPEGLHDARSCEAFRAACNSSVVASVGPADSCQKLAIEREDQGLGAFVPRCLEDGTYAPYQCHPSTGSCWCSDAAGQEVFGTLRGPAKLQFSREDCEAIRNQCGHERICAQAAETANKTSLRGAFIPQCDEFGGFAPKQCHWSIEECWCVDDAGREMQGTRGGAEVTDTECALKRQYIELPHTSCELEHKKSQAVPGFSRNYIPMCEADGSYSLMQCQQLDGLSYCWCVDGDGRELRGTRDHPHLTHDVCADLLQRGNQSLSLCQQRHTDASSRQRSGLAGVFLPRCNEDGTFAARQCHGSTGHCWCSDPEGNELSGTRGRPGPTKDSHCEELIAFVPHAQTFVRSIL